VSKPERVVAPTMVKGHSVNCNKSVPREKRLASGINDSLIRLSCGIEDADDLIYDLQQAFDNAKRVK